jgi:hypothetical protein
VKLVPEEEAAADFVETKEGKHDGRGGAQWASLMTKMDKRTCSQRAER